MGTGEIALLDPVSLRVSASISLKISSKSVNFFPLQWRNSPYSEETDTEERRRKNIGCTTANVNAMHPAILLLLYYHTATCWQILIQATITFNPCTMCACLPVLAFNSWRTKGLRVTIPEPRGRKSLLEKETHSYKHKGNLRLAADATSHLNLILNN